jgi:hypothetical protein
MMSGTRSPEEYHHTADDDEPAQLGSPWRTPPASPGRRSSPTSRAGSRFNTSGFRLDVSAARRTREFVGQRANDVIGTAAV